ncbi:MULTISPECIES: ANL family adenylate-forming protein [unclassified Variovorax]|uniref:ANL family adenylate-forming protein n=1 Tax=unclassified Variovorax TaxID=663243 RepID=UPI003F46E147
MSQIQFLLDRFASKPEAPAVVFRGASVNYGELSAAIAQQQQALEAAGVQPGVPVILRGDYSALAVSMLLALIERCCIIIPLTPEACDSLGASIGDVAPEWLIDVSKTEASFEKLAAGPLPELYKIVIERAAPGLVLFTSGSSGKPKAVVHDFSKLMEKFHAVRPAMITLNFLLFDHWGGLNTLLHCLSNLCLIVVPAGRSPEQVCALVAAHRIELLPATPSFLSMLLISKAYLGHDLGSLKLITYGAEPMPETTLRNLRKVFPGIELRQTYGMIELGVLRAKSRSPDSLWVKLGGEGYSVRVVDGMLQIRADSAMLGYINAPSPFTEDGFLMTGDLVETDGEWIRVLGRQSDIINVGGQKVYPAEVEAVLLDCPEVADAVVYGEPNPLLGKIVCAQVILREGFDEAAARSGIRKLGKERLQPFMIPAKIKFVTEIAQSHRLKRVRAKS